MRARGECQVVNIQGRALYVRSAAPKGTKSGVPVVMLHGATLASELFDAGPASWLEHFANLGHPVYAIDLPGYGRSEPIEEDPEVPLELSRTRAADMQPYVGAFVDWVRERTSSDGVILFGASWGSVVAGVFAATTGRQALHGLVLYAPFYGARNRHGLDWLSSLGHRGGTGARWRSFDLASFEERWMEEARRSSGEDLVERAVLDAIAGDVALGTRSSDEDPDAATATRVANGCLIDLYDTFSGRPAYDVSRIDCEILLLAGADDPLSLAEDRRAIMAGARRDVTNVVVSPGTHFALIERNRAILMRSAADFAARLSIKGALHA